MSTLALYELLKVNAIYQWGDELLCAVLDMYGDGGIDSGTTWRLYLVNADGEYIAPSQGQYAGYELRQDGEWDRLFYSAIPSLWPGWRIRRGVAVKLNVQRLHLLSEKRGPVAVAPAQDDEPFFDMMAPLQWEWAK
jgi:hypothetical protein